MIEHNGIILLDKELMEKMCHQLAVAVFDTEDDPIAQFHQHDFPLLDSALQAPRQTYNGKDLYPSIESKAAILYYGLNRNHPFHNGNKRIATASLLVFLGINGFSLEVPRDQLLAKTLHIAKAPTSEREMILKELEQWIADNLQINEAQ